MVAAAGYHSASEHVISLQLFKGSCFWLVLPTCIPASDWSMSSTDTR